MIDRSDVEAKTAFINELLSRQDADGNALYQSAYITQKPADITAIRNGMTYYFEIKFTRAEKRYFGAATLTEWEAAIEFPDSYWFVIARNVSDQWRFTEYSPKEFMRFSYVPPFKVFFNVPFETNNSVVQRKMSKTVRLTQTLIEEMVSIFRRFREQ